MAASKMQSRHSSKSHYVFTQIVMSNMFLQHFRNVLLSNTFIHQYLVKLNPSLKTCYCFAGIGFHNVQLNYSKILLQG